MLSYLGSWLNLRELPTFIYLIIRALDVYCGLVGDSQSDTNMVDPRQVLQFSAPEKFVGSPLLESHLAARKSETWSKRPEEGRAE